MALFYFVIFIFSDVWLNVPSLNTHSESLGFCATSIVRNSILEENTVFRKVDLFLSWGESSLSVYRPSPEKGNRPCFRNVVFSSNLEFRSMDLVHKPRDPECYTPMSVPSRFYLWRSLRLCVLACAVHIGFSGRFEWMYSWCQSEELLHRITASNVC
jgi:hypothetical protein